MSKLKKSGSLSGITSKLLIGKLSGVLEYNLFG